jgi:hypothetical protein
MKESVKYSDILSFNNIPKYVLDLIFACLFIIVSIGFNYHEIMFERPQGVHVWRQTDCASMALNYHQKDLSLLHPQMHFRMNDKAEALGEFPIMYFVVGKLYSVFGYHEFIYRLLWYAIAFAGSFCLFRLAYLMLNLPLESLFIGLMLFISPVVAFYTIGFISDPIALYAVPISLYILYRAYITNNYWHFLIAIFVIALAGILKISSLIIPLALLGIYLLYSIFGDKRKDALNPTEKGDLFSILSEIRLPQFYNEFMLLLLIVLSGLSFLKRRFHFWISAFSFTALLGLVFYSLLFFQQFRYHDYYMINAVIIIPVLFITAFRGIKDLELWRSVGFAIKIVFIFIMVRNTVLTANFVKRRYMNPENEHYITRGYGTLEPYLKEKGIDLEDFVISIPDESPNTTLYLMNRSGWSNLYHHPMKPGDIDEFKKMGAKYLIIGDEKLLHDTLLSPYLKSPIGKYKEISLFEL